MKMKDKYTKHYFKRLYLEIGNNYDGFQIIEIKNDKNKLIAEYIPRKFSSREKILKNINVKFEVFFNDLLEINIENWENNYASKLFTGHEWKLKLYFMQSIVIEKQGNNNFPDNFYKLINMIKKYYPDFVADINIRTKLNENDLLKLYCTYNEGYSFSEVSIGNKNIFGKNSKDRRIDIVRIMCDHKYVHLKYANNKETFEKYINGDYEIEIIEIKTKLNRPVIGQVIVAEYMFKKIYGEKNITKVILYHEGDEALELFCNEKNIKLIKY